MDFLVTEQDPEYHWSDNFRTPRSSNEARQRLLSWLNGELRKQVAKKILEMGGNAVIGYQLYFDFEPEERCISARCIGTACKLTALEPPAAVSSVGGGGSKLGLSSPSVLMSPKPLAFDSQCQNISDAGNIVERLGKPSIVAGLDPGTDAFVAPESTTIEGMDSSMVEGETASQRLVENQEDEGAVDAETEKSDQSSEEVQPKVATKSPELLFLTVQKFPPGVIISLGGVVSAHSVKLLTSEDRDRDIRDIWWTELRNEIKSHARTLGCPHVVGYVETAAIQEDMFLLSAYGTAAQLDLSALASSGYTSTMDSHGFPSPSYQKLTLDEVKMNIFAVKKPVFQDLPLEMRMKKKKSLKSGKPLILIPSPDFIISIPFA